MQGCIGTKRDRARSLRQSALSLLHHSPYFPRSHSLFSSTLSINFGHHLFSSRHIITKIYSPFKGPYTSSHFPGPSQSSLDTLPRNQLRGMNLKATKTSRQRGPAASCLRHPRLIHGGQPFAQLHGGCLRLRVVNTATHRYLTFRRLVISAWAPNDRRSRGALEPQ